MFSFEKQGGRIREERQMEAFRKVLKDCELADLDKGVANPKWWDLFTNFKVNYLQYSFSDNCPLVVSTKKMGITTIWINQGNLDLMPIGF
ncbi:reverse transcriptase [Gossypium australe]|uniref:Reverse transcriptase n=1 Tax=Gossypium australe TaxID=47621 RepID=A0A5B6VUL7_9ROSI|nr:reverse transcriptase [Gossypium australe]